jgi:IMP and pyridine-specific 5'-nucleotidase
MVQEYIQCKSDKEMASSRLKVLVPSVGRFFTKLPLSRALPFIDQQRSLCGRKFVAPSFNDIRHLLNHAQILEIAKSLKLITFDGDMTLYADGKDFSRDSKLVGLIISLLQNNIKVAIVTAAGYPGDSRRYEQRLSGLIDGFKQCANRRILENFYVMGGECNYLFKFNAEKLELEYIPEGIYQPEFIQYWSNNTERIKKLVNVAENHLKDRIADLELSEKVAIYRKERAIGVNPKQGHKLSREQLDELALSTQNVLNRYQTSEPDKPIPFCAFNGGSDVWVDIGNKLIGVKILLEWFGLSGAETLHVGDQV